jgi:hypothetical protein
MNSDGLVDSSDLAMLAQYWLQGSYPVQAVTPDEATLLVHYAFDAQSGKAVEDLSPHKFHAEIRGGPDPDAIRHAIGGLHGSGYIAFDGIHYIKIPSASLTAIDDQVTVSLWMNQEPDSWCRSVRPLEFITGLLISTDKNTLTWNPNASPPCVSGWHHYAFVKNAEEGLMQIYCDGTIIAQMSDAFESISDIDADSVFIGADLQGTDRFDGAIDDFKIYGYAMSAGEIAALYGGPDSEILQPIVPAVIDVEPFSDGVIDLLDFSIVADMWLQDNP